MSPAISIASRRSLKRGDSSASSSRATTPSGSSSGSAIGRLRLLGPRRWRRDDGHSRNAIAQWRQDRRSSRGSYPDIPRACPGNRVRYTAGLHVPYQGVSLLNELLEFARRVRRRALLRRRLWFTRRGFRLEVELTDDATRHGIARQRLDCSHRWRGDQRRKWILERRVSRWQRVTRHEARDAGAPPEEPS